MILSIDDRLPPYWRPPPVKDTTSWLCGRLVISGLSGTNRLALTSWLLLAVDPLPVNETVYRRPLKMTLT
jgi:hypothetical protein